MCCEESQQAVAIGDDDGLETGGVSVCHRVG
jgi:hypothetical protein